jgi:uncharacterized protein YecT (DUF1311 family)
MEAARILRMAGVGFSLFLLLAIEPLSASDISRERCGIVPDSWAPSLAQVQDYIEASSKAETKVTQQLLTKTSQNMADLRDAELFIAYVQLMQALAPQERIKLFKEQERWLSERDKRAQAAVVSKGGTLEPLEYSGVYRSITERRLSELRQLLWKTTRDK